MIEEVPHWTPNYIKNLKISCVSTERIALCALTSSFLFARQSIQQSRLQVVQKPAIHHNDDKHSHLSPAERQQQRDELHRRLEATRAQQQREQPPPVVLRADELPPAATGGIQTRPLDLAKKFAAVDKLPATNDDDSKESGGDSAAAQRPAEVQRTREEVRANMARQQQAKVEREKREEEARLERNANANMNQRFVQKMNERDIKRGVLRTEL